MKILKWFSVYLKQKFCKHLEISIVIDYSVNVYYQTCKNCGKDIPKKSNESKECDINRSMNIIINQSYKTDKK